MSFKKIYLVSDVDRERAIQFGDTDYHWLLISFASPVDRFTSPVVRRIVLWSLGMMLVLALVCYLTAERRVRGVLAAKRLADSVLLPRRKGSDQAPQPSRLRRNFQ